MAVSVAYRIKAEDQTRTATRQATGNLDKLDRSTSTFASNMNKAFTAIKFVAVVKGIQLISNKVGALADLYGVQAKAESDLAQAAANNPYLDGSSARSLANYASELQSISTFGDEAIIQQQAMLATMGLTEDQIREVSSAAVDLASSGVMSLDSAFRNLGKTYGGTAGELGELIPQMRGLTEEQLKSGEAIDIVAESYAGMAESASGVFGGIKKQFENSVGDLGESAGRIFAAVQSIGYERLQPLIENLTDWFNENGPKIINLFVNLPEVARAVFDAIHAGFVGLFTSEGLRNAAGVIWEYLSLQFINLINWIGSILNAVGTTIWEPLKFGFEIVAYSIRTVWRGIIDGLRTGFETVINGVVNLLNVVLQPLDWILHQIKNIEEHGVRFGQYTEYTQGAGGVANIGVVEFEAPEREELVRPQWEGRGELIGEAWADAWDSTKDFARDTWENLKDYASGITRTWHEPFEGLRDELGTIMNQELPERMQQIINPLERSIDDNTQITEDNTSATEDNTDRRERQPTGSGAPRADEAGGEISATVPFSAMVISFLEDVGQAFLDLIAPIEALRMLMDPLGLIFQSLVDTIGPIVNQILAPMVGMFKIIGQVLGGMLLPVLSLLSPIIELVGQAFVWLHNNVLAPFHNGIVFLGNAIYNAFASVINWVIDLINAGLGWAGVDIKRVSIKDPKEGFIDRIETEDLTTESGITGGTSAGSGSGASYTAARDITVNIEINTDVITGDDGGLRELARILMREMEEVQALNV